ncbi:MAG: cytochrome c-type biogenesis protein CcmH [Actinobacteria bacterium]|nr:cytochrome c-type biogenesis protein CcmH [Actinomycetota bacterium]
MLTAVALLLLVFAGLGLVRGAGPDAAPTSRAQVDAVAATIRCPTCQGLSVKDSPSVLADGSRQIIEEQVAQGRSADQIRQYFVDRYGEYILLSPDPAGPGAAVWVLPAVVLAGAGALVLRWQRRGRAGRLALVGPGAGVAEAAGVDDATDGDALLAAQAFRTGTLDPDDSPAGEALREALVVRLAAETDELPDRAALHRADLRLGAAYRRYTRRRAPAATPRTGRAGALPRRAVTALVAVLVVASAGTALAMAVRTRGAGDLPTGDLPGGSPAAAAAPAAPGLAELTAAARERPDDPDAWLALGRALDAGARFGPALAAYDRALQLRPQADDVAVLRAGVLVRAGSPTEALPVLEQLAGRYPDDPDTVLLLGIAQHKTGAPAAPATLRRYLELAPYSSAAAGVRDLLAGT